MKNLFLLFCLLTLFGQNRSFAQCSPDVTPPVAVCVSELSRDVSPNAVGFITLNAADFDAGSYDNCDPSNTLNYFIEVAPQSATPPSTTSLTFSQADAGDQSIVLWVVDAAGNATTCETTLHLTICANSALICNAEVTVELSANGTYPLDAFDILEGGPYCDYNIFQVALEQPSGFTPEITLTIDDIGEHQVFVSGLGAICWSTVIVESGISLNSQCPQLYVSMATPHIEPCVNGSYSVLYANASTLPVANSYVDVALDDDLQYQNASIAGTALGNNVYRFPTGDLAAGQAGNFSLQFLTKCDAAIGATHCSEARISPKTLCAGNQAWSGAEIAVEGTCINDEIHLKIRNLGAEATTQVLDYVVVEDVLMLTHGTFNLAGNASMDLNPIAGSGATYRIEAQQEPGYPYGGRPAMSVEGCGGLNPGMVTIFPMENSNPAISVSCVENALSLVANAQQTWPKGYDAEHFVEKNTDLQYMINFENTAIGTASRLVILDTLSSLLDAQSVRLGASSHACKFDLLADNILRITFEDLQLGSTTVNPEAGKGFVQFSIQQKADNPVDSRIENRASIYFDYKAPIRTVPVFHTVGEKFIATVATNEAAAQGLSDMKVFPNPGIGRMYFEPAVPVTQNVSFVLNDMLGRQVRQLNEVTFPMSFERNGLENGTYFFRFIGRDGKTMWSGKIMMK